ncbi:type 4a pilus biogenesis protein PilO, partial [Patescibacteria group bacterium]
MAEKNTEKRIPTSEDTRLMGGKKLEEKKGLSVDINKIKEALLNFVVPLVSLVVSVFLIILFVYPTIKSYPEVKAELEQKATLRDTLQKKISNLRKLVDFKEFVEEDSELVSKVLVSEAEVPKLLDQVHQIATNSGMVVDRLSYSYGGGDQEGAAYNVVVVSLGTSTNYDQIILFMEFVENAARFVGIPSFRYSSSRTTEGENNLSANFSIDSPYLFIQSNAVT